MKKKIKKKKRHIHKIIELEICNNCGYQEGYCEGCGEHFSRDSYDEKWSKG